MFAPEWANCIAMMARPHSARKCPQHLPANFSTAVQIAKKRLLKCIFDFFLKSSSQTLLMNHSQHASQTHAENQNRFSFSCFFPLSAPDRRLPLLFT